MVTRFWHRRLFFLCRHCLEKSEIKELLVEARQNPRGRRTSSADDCESGGSNGKAAPRGEDEDDGEGEGIDMEFDPEQLKKITKMGLSLFWRYGLSLIATRVGKTISLMMEVERLEYSTIASKAMAKERVHALADALLDLGNAFKVSGALHDHMRFFCPMESCGYVLRVWGFGPLACPA